eukprot:SAG31_NODE_34047_length_337_cov_0.848739_2_plen_55_part_01
MFDSDEEPPRDGAEAWPNSQPQRSQRKFGWQLLAPRDTHLHIDRDVQLVLALGPL